MKSHGDPHNMLDVPNLPRAMAGGVLLVWILCGLIPANAQTVAKTKAPEQDTEAKAKAGKPQQGASGEAPQGALANNGLKAFGEMIPLGRRSRGVRIPSFDQGKPTSVISAGALIRVDDNRLFAEKLIIDLFGQKPEEDVRVDLKTGTYNMDHQILSSTERSRVSRSDFQIEGDGMVFDTKTSQGKMVGNVEMIIYDVKQLAKNLNMVKEEEPAPAADQKKTDTRASDGRSLPDSASRSTGNADSTKGK